MNVDICHYHKISGVKPKLLEKVLMVYKSEIIGKNPNGLMRLVKPLHWDDYDVIT